MMNHEVIFSRLNRRNRPMERRKFKSHLPAAAYLIIFLIYIIYLFVGAGKFILKNWIIMMILIKIKEIT